MNDKRIFIVTGSIGYGQRANFGVFNTLKKAKRYAMDEGLMDSYIEEYRINGAQVGGHKVDLD